MVYLRGGKKREWIAVLLAEMLQRYGLTSTAPIRAGTYGYRPHQKPI